MKRKGNNQLEDRKQKKKATAKDNDKKKGVPAADTVTEFIKWCNGVKLLHPKCTIGQCKGTGRGVVATERISEGEVVISVPDDAVLMVESCSIADQLEEAGLAKGIAEDALLEVQGLILAVMAEKVLGRASSWAPYLQFIPTDLTHLPMYWKDEELQQLRGTAALDKMEGKVQSPADAPTQVRMLWEEVAEPFILENPELRIPPGDKGWQLYQWATAAVASYSFLLGDDQYQGMVPFWDALNHITGQVNVRLHHQVTTRSGKGCLQMIATRDVAEGEELVNNYGELSQVRMAKLQLQNAFIKHCCQSPSRSADAASVAILVTCVLLHEIMTHGTEARFAKMASDKFASLSWLDEASSMLAYLVCISAELLRGYGYVEEHDQANMYAHVQVPLKFVLQAVASVSLQGNSAIAQQHSTQPASSHRKPSGLGQQRHDHADLDVEDECDLSDGGSEWDLESDSEDLDGAQSDEECDFGITSNCLIGNANKAAASKKNRKSDSVSKTVVNERPSSSPADAKTSNMDSVKRAQCRQAVRGLPGRLRFLKKVGLLPVTNVFKIFMPGSSRGDSKKLLECVRLLQLPLQEFIAVTEAVGEWRPGPVRPTSKTTQSNRSRAAGMAQLTNRHASHAQKSNGVSSSTVNGDHGMNHPMTDNHRSNDHGDDDAGDDAPLVYVGEVTCESAAAVCGAVSVVAEYMLSRYTTTLQQDEALLADPQLQPRHRSAILARKPEKQCLLGLSQSLGHGKGDSCDMSPPCNSSPVGKDSSDEEAAIKLVRSAMNEYWGKPRPGMFGIPGVGENNDDDSDDFSADDMSNDASGAENEGEDASDDHDGSGDGVRKGHTSVHGAKTKKEKRQDSRDAVGLTNGVPTSVNKLVAPNGMKTDKKHQAVQGKTEGFSFGFQL